MELAHLVLPVKLLGPARLSWPEALVRCLLLGALLLAGQRLVSPAPAPTLKVTVKKSASEAEVQRAIEEEVALQLALRAQLQRRDPVVQQQLKRNLTLAGISGGVETALALDMHQSDPVVRSRLVWLGSELASSSVSASAPSDAELVSFAEERPWRYAAPTAARFEHVFLDPKRSDVPIEERARELEAQLDERSPAQLSDPIVIPSKLPLTSKRRIDATFGVGFASQVLELPVGKWSGALRSSYGLHFVRVHEKQTERLPPLETIRKRVLHDYYAETRKQRAAEALARLARGYDVQVVSL